MLTYLNIAKGSYHEGTNEAVRKLCSTTTGYRIVEKKPKEVPVGQEAGAIIAEAVKGSDQAKKPAVKKPAVK